MNETRHAILKKQIQDQLQLFEEGLDNGVEFSALRKIWLDLKTLKLQWKTLTDNDSKDQADDGGSF